MKGFREKIREITFQVGIRRKLLIMLVLLVLILPLVGCEQGTMSKILFISERAGNSDIYIMDADGGNQINLNNNPSLDESPCWSPDGKKIMFVSDRDGNREIYIMDADGSNLINLSNNPASDERPSWLPDGKKILFESNRDGKRGIYIMDADGTNPTKLPCYPDEWQVYALSPDGKTIAFQIASDIRVLDIETGEETNLTNNPSWDLGPICWSPDGKEIAFTSGKDGHLEIYLIGADGNNLKRLTTYSGNIPPQVGMVHPGYRGLAWFPDGEKLLAWLYDVEISWDLYSIDKDGNNQVNLTRDLPDRGGFPFGSCSHDGKRVAFSIMIPHLPESGGYDEIWVVDADGTNLTRLTYNQVRDVGSVWQPC